jgi:glycosyltransferase involved in cell wall biosynthesis
MSPSLADLVSTVIPVHNRAVLLREAVASILAQTYRPIEIIIVDDGSTDETVQVCEELARQHPNEIRVVYQANAGPGLAREAGRRIARGEFIQYLDSDDRLLPEKFLQQVAGLKAHPECGISYGKTRFIERGERGDETAWKRTGEEIKSMFPSFLESRWWGTSTPLYRKELLEIVGPWSSLSNEEDWEYDCRIAATGVLLHYVPEFISEERDHGGERLSRGGTTTKHKLQHRAAAHKLMLQHAHRAGIDATTPEMQHFARELFLLSRQCGAVGLSAESKELFALARQASGENRARGWDFKLYNLLASIFGWSSVGKLACYSDGFRR